MSKAPKVKFRAIDPLQDHYLDGEGIVTLLLALSMTRRICRCLMCRLRPSI